MEKYREEKRVGWETSSGYVRKTRGRREKTEKDLEGDLHNLEKENLQEQKDLELRSQTLSLKSKAKVRTESETQKR